MARVAFTANLRRHISVEESEVPGATVGEALGAVFSRHPTLRGYVLDDQGAVRKHIVVFLDGAAITDRTKLSDAVAPNSEICVMQALSGG